MEKKLINKIEKLVTTKNIKAGSSNYKNTGAKNNNSRCFCTPSIISEFVCLLVTFSFFFV